jgi:hypothetical protein
MIITGRNKMANFSLVHNLKYLKDQGTAFSRNGCCCFCTLLTLHEAETKRESIKENNGTIALMGKTTGLKIFN